MEPHTQEDEYRASGKARVRHRDTSDRKQSETSPPRTLADKQEDHFVKALIDAEVKQRGEAMAAVVQRAFREAHCPYELVRGEHGRRGSSPTISVVHHQDDEKKQKNPHKPRHVNLGRHGRDATEEKEEEPVFMLEPYSVMGRFEAWGTWSYVLGNEEILFSFTQLQVRQDKTYLHTYPPDWTWFPEHITQAGRRLKMHQCRVSWRGRQPKVEFLDMRDEPLEGLTKQLQKAAVQDAKKDARRRNRRRDSEDDESD